MQQEENLNQQVREEIKKLKEELGYKSLSGDKPDKTPEAENEGEKITEGPHIPQMKLSYNRPPLTDMVQIDRSEVAAKYLKALFEPGSIDLQERFIVLFLNRANYVLGYQTLAFGGLTSVVVDVRLILASAIKCLCTSLILCHNHPSGNLKPSTGDRLVTDQLRNAAKYHEISVVDHIILTSEGYFSMADEGIINAEYYV
ncbi:MAG TPA: JAB domain-containing protein [Flavobacteriales bacterium]|nr:JAB domain-containing protein [Flavobacteriales bacterium]